MSFYEKIADILEEEEISGETNLKDCENWDSLSVLSIVAMVDKVYKVTLSVYDIRAISTPDELLKLIEDKKNA